MPSVTLGNRISLALRALVGTFPTGTSAQTAGGLLSGVSQQEPPTRGANAFLQAYSTMPWLRATTHRIAESIAATQWHVFAVRRGRKFVSMPGLMAAPSDTRKKELAKLKQSGELVEIEDTPLLRVLNLGNPVLIGGNTRRVTQIHLDILGEAFWIKGRTAGGVVETVWPVPPTWVQQTPSVGRPFYQMSFGQWQEKVSDTEVIWFRDPNPANPYGRGSGVAQSLGDELEIDEYAAKHVKSWFFNSAIPPIIVAPKVGAAEWSEPARLQMKSSWQHEHQGLWRSFKAQFSRVPLDVHELTHTFREQQLGELRIQERDMIVQVLGIPPEIIGIIENSNRATIDGAQFLYATNVLVPRLEHLRETLQLRLVPEYDERLILDYDSPVPEDKTHILEVAKAQPQSLTQNEWRGLMDEAPTATGDVFHVPINVMPTDTLGGTPPRGSRLARSIGIVASTEQINGKVSKSEIEILKDPLFVDETPDDEFYRIIHSVADRLTPGLQSRFVEIVRDGRSNINMAALENALRGRAGIMAIEDNLPFVQIVEALREASEETFIQSIVATGEQAATHLSDQIGLSIGFVEADPIVVNFARQQAAQLVSFIDEGNRQAIRESVALFFEENLDPRLAAELIQEEIGLLPRQAKALIKHAADLRAQGFSEAVIGDAIGSASEGFLLQRSQMIARTELIDVGNEGQQILWRQAADRGEIEAENTRRFWVVTPDDRLDFAICEPIPRLNPKGVKLGEPFNTPQGPRMRPTAHPGCRCTVTLRFIK